MLEMYETKIFTDIWNTAEDFITDWKSSGIYEATLSGTTPIISDTSVNLTFFLLYSKYGNSPIANYDVHQFAYKVFSIIFQYGPSWEKRLDIQKRLRGLTETELISGTKMIYNHAFNPSTTPSTDTLEELQAINDQNTSKVRKGYVEAYTQLWEMIATDVTNEYINRFQKLFRQFVNPDIEHIYVTEETEDEEDE